MTVTIRHLRVFFFNDHPILVDVSADDAFGELGFRDSNMYLGELTLVHTTLSEGTFDHLDVRGAICELDLSPGTDFLSIVPEALVKAALLEEDAAAVHLSHLVELTDVSALVAITVDKDGLAIDAHLARVVVEVFLLGGLVLREEVGQCLAELVKFGVLRGNIAGEE